MRLGSVVFTKQAWAIGLCILLVSGKAIAADCKLPSQPRNTEESLIVGDIGAATFLSRSSNGNIETTRYLSTVKIKKVLSPRSRSMPDQIQLVQRQVLWLATNDYWSAPITENTRAVFVVKEVKTGEYELIDVEHCTLSTD